MCHVCTHVCMYAKRIWIEMIWDLPETNNRKMYVGIPEFNNRNMYVCIYVSKYVCVRVCMYVCMYVCMCVDGWRPGMPDALESKHTETECFAVRILTTHAYVKLWMQYVHWLWPRAWIVVMCIDCGHVHGLWPRALIVVMCMDCGHVHGLWSCAWIVATCI
jgi:hypothetical protein